MQINWSETLQQGVASEENSDGPLDESFTMEAQFDDAPVDMLWLFGEEETEVSYMIHPRGSGANKIQTKPLSLMVERLRPLCIPILMQEHRA